MGNEVCGLDNNVTYCPCFGTAVSRYLSDGGILDIELNQA